jgi:hypothetical protein
MIRKALLGALLASLAHGGMALTIGRPHGAVVLGQPLALSFDLQLDSEDNADSACVEVEVLQGDIRMDPSRIRVSTSTQGQNARVQVKTTSAVEEPVVSVNLRAGCTQRVSRHYQFLSDFPGDGRGVAPAAATAAPVSVANLPVAAPAAPAAAAAAANRNPARTLRVATPGAGVAPGALPALPRKPLAERAVRPRERAAAKTVPRPSAGARPTSATAAPRARLQLDAAPSQALPAQDVGLKTSSELRLPSASASSAAVPAERAKAAAQWRAMNTQAGDAPDPGSQAALESSLQTLQAAAARERASLADLQNQLHQAQEERYANALVYTLLALLLAALALAAYLWRRGVQAARKASSPEWWVNAGAAAAPDGGPRGISGLAVLESDESSFGYPHSRHTRVDVDVEALASRPAPLVPRRAPVPAPTDAPAPAYAPAVAAAAAGRSPIHPAGMFDVQQHADFFLSLGQYSQAIEVLRSYLGEHRGASPAIYLDLLRVYQAVGRSQDYAQLAQEFSTLFNVAVPDMDTFGPSERQLEDYPAAMALVQSSWLDPHIQDVLESLIRRTSPSASEGFQLDAFRDLLLLHAVSGRDAPSSMVMSRFDSLAPASSWSSDFMASRPAGVADKPASAPVPLAGGGADMFPLLPPEGSSGFMDFDLDLDLTAASSPASAPSPLPAAPSSLVEFDLFDPTVEDDIAPRSMRR